MQQGLTDELIGLRVARELKDGMYVNLGIGIPTLASNFLQAGQDIILHAENGVLGYGAIIMQEGKWDDDLVNAGVQPVDIVPGACFFDLGTAFGMVRGRHLDVTVLGGFQVSEKGDLANWSFGWREGAIIGGIGGAMELATGAKRVIVAMRHTTASGELSILKECTLPLTAREAVNTVITSLAYIEVTPQGLVLKEVAQGVTAEEVQQFTEPKLIISPELKEMEL